MSCTPATTTATKGTCANCGKEGTEAVKLKNCTACFLVKYCSVGCQKTHRKQHKKACKKRAAELKDEELYSQGHERVEADFCPICLLAIPFPTNTNSVVYVCCMKSVCTGCCLAAKLQGLFGEPCPFCRTPGAKGEEEDLEMIQKRVNARDPEAIFHLGDLHSNGTCGLEKSESRAIELWSEAAELGSTMALTKMGMSHYYGEHGVTQNKAKGVRCWETAAIQGATESRSFLGLIKLENRKCDRAVRHFLISAKMGHKGSVDSIKKMFARGLATKAQYTEALKGIPGRRGGDEEPRARRSGGIGS